MKKIVVLLILCIFTAGFVFAQEETEAPAPSGPKTDNKLFGIKTGFVAGQNMDTQETVSGRDFALFFTLSDSMEIGFRTITDILNTDVMLFDLCYFMGEKISIDIMAGSTTDAANETAAGIDVGFAIVKTSGESAFSSSLKLEAGYLFEAGAGVAAGAVFAGLVGNIGY